MGLLLKIITSILFLLFMGSRGAAQNVSIYRTTSSYTSFPDSARANGHTYNKKIFPAAEHYMDSSVIILTPKNFHAGKTVDIIFWFHGWGSNIDSAIARTFLERQFTNTRVNAILVLAETAKNASDSYGGKLEKPGVFKNLVTDVLNKLKAEKVIDKNCKPGNILLAGHSGAYRVMAHILQNGDMRVKEVILFDALYSETDKFINWIQSDSNNRFINIYTNGGGTDVESREMARRLIALRISTDTLEEKDVTPTLLQSRKIIIIHSLNSHSGILKDPDNIQLFIENSPFLKKRK